MWIKQKVKNKAGDYEQRCVWWEPPTKELPVTYSSATSLPSVATTVTYGSSLPSSTTATYTPAKPKRGKKA